MTRRAVLHRTAFYAHHGPKRHFMPTNARRALLAAAALTVAAGPALAGYAYWRLNGTGEDHTVDPEENR